MTIRARRVERRIRLLMAARSLRSLAQGALVVDFALYLRTLGWPAARIGTLRSQLWRAPPRRLPRPAHSHSTPFDSENGGTDGRSS
jgi:hypothetical protein